MGEARKLSVGEHENLCNWNMSQSENCFINYVLSYIVKSLTCKIAKRIKYTKKKTGVLIFLNLTKLFAFLESEKKKKAPSTKYFKDQMTEYIGS